MEFGFFWLFLFIILVFYHNFCINFYLKYCIKILFILMTKFFDTALGFTSEASTLSNNASHSPLWIYSRSKPMPSNSWSQHFLPWEPSFVLILGGSSQPFLRPLWFFFSLEFFVILDLTFTYLQCLFSGVHPSCTGCDHRKKVSLPCAHISACCTRIVQLEKQNRRQYIKIFIAKNWLTS